MHYFPGVVRSSFTVFLATLGFLFVGCSTSKTLSNTEHQSLKTPPKYSLIYIIHGDANYLYHENGERHQADEETLKSALNIAKSALSGEVFIFHQNPERRILGIFPKKDRTYYHFVHGVLAQESKYSPLDGGFTKEAEIYSSLANPNPKRNFLFYFGHEIPTFSGQKYHSSMPSEGFNTTIFSQDIAEFEPSFDLTILATCNNGNPLMMELLKDRSNFVIASPQNLHLSYLNLEPLSLLEDDPEIKTNSLADSIAHHSFETLSRDLQTMVTVGVYDLSLINSYSSALSSKYNHYLESVSAKPRFTDNIDCQSIEGLTPLLEKKGVHLYYKPPAFGRKSDQKSHSGWGCKE